MRLDGRRESSNVEDRRGRGSGKTIAGVGGIGGIIMVLLFALLGGGNINDFLGDYDNGGPNQEMYSEQEQELATFSKKILAGTEDVWSEVFEENGLGEYNPPRMVLYTGSTSTACGQGNAQMGPFYCSADQTVYIDLSFFSSMHDQLGADGDFAYAYVIAHEVGHHVQYLLGTLNAAHNQMARMSQADANEVSVQLELQADYYAGLWAHHDNKMFRSLEEDDLEEAIRCARVIGDDYLQRQAQGYEVPESFTHGTSAQRMNALKAGFAQGTLGGGRMYLQ